MLQDRLELSERRACRVTGQHRSTQRRLPARGRGDDALRTELHAFSRGHPRWGYRRAWATLHKKSEPIEVSARIVIQSVSTVSDFVRLTVQRKCPLALVAAR